MDLNYLGCLAFSRQEIKGKPRPFHELKNPYQCAFNQFIRVVYLFIYLLCTSIRRAQNSRRNEGEAKRAEKENKENRASRNNSNKKMAASSVTKNALEAYPRRSPTVSDLKMERSERPDGRKIGKSKIGSYYIKQ